MDFVVGIDVGGPKKGFHVAIQKCGENMILGTAHFLNPTDVVQYIRNLQILYQGNCLAIAIDAPEKALREKIETRAAERELAKRGYRVLWTPRKAEQKQSWMVHGENLWSALKENFSKEILYETFPTANSNLLFKSVPQLSFNLLQGKSQRNYYTDYLDACICVQVAQGITQGKTISLGEREDEQRGVHILDVQFKPFVLAIIQNQTQILLGHKKKGLGKTLWNGFGGKVEACDDQHLNPALPSKNPFVNALIREVKEECGLVVEEFDHAATLFFSFEVETEIFQVEVFRVSHYSGQPVETAEMRPEWFELSNIPYDQMWADDRLWLPPVLAGKKVEGSFAFKNYDQFLSHRIKILD